MTEVSENNPSATEEWFTAEDGHSIYRKTWHTNTNPIATLVFVHGFGEHCNRYNHVFEVFAKNGIQVLAFDQRGFGRTGKKSQSLGVTGGYAKAIPDITEALKSAMIPGTPLFLMGHSYGGGLVLNYDCFGPLKHELSGVIATAPLIIAAPPTRPNGATITVVSAIAKIFPSLQIPVSLSSSFISRNKDEIAKYDSDPLVHGVGSTRGAADMLNDAKALLTHRYKDVSPDIPLLITHGTADALTCAESSKKFFDLCVVKDKEYKAFVDFYHEIHNEDERDQVIDYWVQWILKHANKSGDQ